MQTPLRILGIQLPLQTPILYVRHNYLYASAPLNHILNYPLVIHFCTVDKRPIKGIGDEGTSDLTNPRSTSNSKFGHICRYYPNEKTNPPSS